MNVVKASYEILVPENALQHIERCARVCYKSEDKIAPDGSSATKMVRALVKNGHHAMLEHYSFIFQMSGAGMDTLMRLCADIALHTKYVCYLRFTNVTCSLVSGNIRAWRDFFEACYKMYGYLPKCMEQFIQDNPVLFPEWYGADVFASWLLQPTFFRPVSANELTDATEKLVHKDMTILFTCDRGVSHELVRHRPMSFAQESTRYCNYNGGVSFILPVWIEEPYEGELPSADYSMWRKACQQSEDSYKMALATGWTPQQARCFLHNSVKTEIVMTGNYAEWYHFFSLRACDMAGKAHPQMHEVAIPALEEVQKQEPDIFGDLKAALC